MQVKKQQLEPDMRQQTGSKFGKEYVKAVYCHLAYFTYMQSTSCEMPGWIKAQAGIKITRRNMNNFRYTDDTTPMVESEGELKSLLMKVKASEKVGLKLSIQNTKSWLLVPSAVAAAAAKLLQSCPILCNPIDGNP